MAKNTKHITQTGAPAVLQKHWVYQYTVDTRVAASGSTSKNINGGTPGDYIELIQLEAGDVILSGSLEVVVPDGVGASINLGTSDVGTNLMSAQSVYVPGVFPLHSTDITRPNGEYSVYLSASTVDLTLCVLLVTLVVLKAGDFES